MISGPFTPLSPVRTIAPADWMRAPESAALFAALGGAVLFVGGCVRNLLLGVPVKDFDLATPHRPEEMLALLNGAALRTIPTGIEHGTLTVLIGDMRFEVTSLRRDVETTGRHAVVAFTHDWAEDAARRDFTVNTLLADRDGHIFDPLGTGLADLDLGLVRFVGDADARIQEDYLRILRFFRFHARYGRGAPDGPALAACARHAPHLNSLSRERVTQELLGILSVDDPVAVLLLMKAHDILPRIFAPDYDEGALSHLASFQMRAQAPDALARLLVLAGYDADFIAALDDLLILSTRQKNFIKHLAAIHIGNENAVKIALYRHGRAVALQAVLLQAARAGADFPEAFYRLACAWQIPTFPVGGDDLKALGILPGPAMGAALKAGEEWWIERDFEPGRDACLAYIKANY